MSIAETDELRLSYLESTANYYCSLSSSGKNSLPISEGTVHALRKELFKQILEGGVCEEYADMAQRVLSTAAKALERKGVTAEGRAAIEAEEAHEAALRRQGFKFWPNCGDFVKVLGRMRKHQLHLFLSKEGQLTATLICSGGELCFDRELSRWPLSNLEEGLAGVLAEAKNQVASLLA